MPKTKTTKVAKAETSKEVLPSKVDWTADQVELIKQTVAVGATDNELKLFLYTAQRTQLDPLTRQIFFVKRWNATLGRQVGAIQTGIDGYRAIAERTGQMAGSDDVIFEEDENPKLGPKKATVTVYRIVKGMRVPFTASALWSEYAPVKAELAFMWNKMPHLMLGKVAEALALRKAFPLNLSGIYTNEEMQQADPIVEVEIKPKTAPTQEIKVEKVSEDYSEIKSSISAKLRQIDPTVTAANIHQRVPELVELELIPENYDEIDSRLFILLDEKSK